MAECHSIGQCLLLLLEFSLVCSSPARSLFLLFCFSVCLSVGLMCRLSLCLYLCSLGGRQRGGSEAACFQVSIMCLTMQHQQQHQQHQQQHTLRQFSRTFSAAVSGPCRHYAASVYSVVVLAPFLLGFLPPFSILIFCFYFF